MDDPVPTTATDQQPVKRSVAQDLGDPAAQSSEIQASGRVVAVDIGDSTVELGEASSAFPPRSGSRHQYVADANAVYARSRRGPR